MKPKLQTSLGQHLVLTPQLRQAIHLLQLSSLELDAEIAEAVETNPLLEWEEAEADGVPFGGGESDGDSRIEIPAPEQPAQNDAANGDEAPWDIEGEAWAEHGGGGSFDGSDDHDPGDRAAQTETLQDHLLWQLHLSQLSPRDRKIGAMLIDAIDDDGYLREAPETIRDSLARDFPLTLQEVIAVLRRLQRFDPAGVGARDLGECLRLQLQALPDATPGRALAIRIVAGPIERLPRLGIETLASELDASAEQARIALQLVRSLDPRPGARIGGTPVDTYVTPDCVIWRQHGVWQVALANGQRPRPTIHRGYEQMLSDGRAGADAAYLRNRLQEARWLLKNIEARGETLLKVVRCLVREQSGFLEFGAQALRPLTLREVAAQVELHESTISRAIARKYVRTPRGTLPLRSFFASGIGTNAGGETSSTAIQAMIKELIDAENPRKPLSDARLADTLKANGIPVARRTVAKYREAMNIPSSHERVRLN